jgi:RimJ/RimL family protein N-acetyltransferase
MTRPWLIPPAGPAARHAEAVAATVPVIETPRLTIRAPRLADFPAYEAVFCSDRARHMGGPFTPEAAYADFCQAVAGWMLRGAGLWTICAKGGADALGWIFLWQEWEDPEPELGWVLIPEAEGKGHAAEGAAAVLPLGLERYGAGGFVSYIDAGNDRSARLAERLGARRDLAAEAAIGDADLMVWRHFGQGHRA